MGLKITLYGVMLHTCIFTLKNSERIYKNYILKSVIPVWVFNGIFYICKYSCIYFFTNSFDILIPHTIGHLIAQSIILVFLKKSLTFRSDTRDITVAGKGIHNLDQRSAQYSFWAEKENSIVPDLLWVRALRFLRSHPKYCPI